MQEKDKRLAVIDLLDIKICQVENCKPGKNLPLKNGCL